MILRFPAIFFRLSSAESNICNHKKDIINISEMSVLKKKACIGYNYCRVFLLFSFHEFYLLPKILRYIYEKKIVYFFYRLDVISDMQKMCDICLAFNF